MALPFWPIGARGIVVDNEAIMVASLLVVWASLRVAIAIAIAGCGFIVVAVARSVAGSVAGSLAGYNRQRRMNLDLELRLEIRGW